jgi:hypothetical protein
MNALKVSPLLHLALLIDAVATAACAIGLLLFPAELAALFGLPAMLLTGAGIFMLGYAAVVVWMSRQATLRRWAVWTIIVGNALWALDCAALAFVGVLDPTTLGVSFLLVQAALVIGFAELQYAGMKRSPAAA